MSVCLSPGEGPVAAAAEPLSAGQGAPPDGTVRGAALPTPGLLLHRHLGQ